MSGDILSVDSLRGAQCGGRGDGTIPEETPIDVDEHRDLLRDARDRTAAQIAGLTRNFDEFVEAAELVNTDDEHDPEGQTIAFERAQVISLREEAEVRLGQIDAALHRLDDGTYGRCSSCGGPIGVERLAALPGVEWCVGCARQGPHS